MKKLPANLHSAPLDPPDTDLPEGWIYAKIVDLMEIKYGKGLKGEIRKQGNVEVYGSNGVVGHHDTAITCGPTIIIGRKGTVGAVHWSRFPCWPIDTTYYIEDFQGLYAPFLYFVLRTLGLSELDTSSAIPGLNRDDIYKQVLPLPPLAEQKRIVAKVEELLARVNAARENLSRLPALLKRFRQSVLAAACSGRLTEDWRDENRTSEYHPATNCLGNSELREIPDTWRWIRLGVLGADPKNPIQTGPFGAQLHRNEFVENGVPVVAVGNLTGMGFTHEGLYFINEAKARDLERYNVEAGDVLFARSGATLGKVCVAPPDARNWRMTGHILRARLEGRKVLPEMAVYALRGDPQVIEQVQGNVRGATRPGYNTALLESILIPIAPLPEQHEIVRRVSRLFALADSIEKQVAAGTARAEKLTQAILAKAFRGELVPAEAELARREKRTFESAAALLARISTGEARNATVVTAPVCVLK